MLIKLVQAEPLFGLLIGCSRLGLTIEPMTPPRLKMIQKTEM